MRMAAREPITDVVPESQFAKMFKRRAILAGAIGSALVGVEWGGFLLLERLIPNSPLNALMTMIGGAVVFIWLYPLLYKRVQQQVVTHEYTINNVTPDKISTSRWSRVNTKSGMLTGKTIGGYDLLHLIDKGGMGEIYASESGGLLLAVKVVDLTQGIDIRQRFEREVEALKLAKHPNVVQVFDSGVDQEQYAYMVMEYIDGVSLRDFIRNHAPVEIDDMIDIVEGIAAAADHMHSMGIVHRDLKPGNIMLYRNDDNRFVPIMLDFGVAKQSGVTVITLDGTVGTIEYMPPEQILEAPLVNPASDVYAVGVMAYEMLTGKLPYQGSVGAMVYGHLHLPVRDPREHNAKLSERAAMAVMKAMAKEPEERFVTLSEFCEELYAGLHHTKPFSVSIDVDANEAKG